MLTCPSLVHRLGRQETGKLASSKRDPLLVRIQETWVQLSMAIWEYLPIKPIAPHMVDIFRIWQSHTLDWCNANVFHHYDVESAVLFFEWYGLMAVSVTDQGSTTSFCTVHTGCSISFPDTGVCDEHASAFFIRLGIHNNNNFVDHCDNPYCQRATSPLSFVP